MALLEEFGDRPEQDSSSRVTRGTFFLHFGSIFTFPNFLRLAGGKIQDEIAREEEELRRFEEENFVRLDHKRLQLEKKRVRLRNTLSIPFDFATYWHFYLAILFNLFCR